MEEMMMKEKQSEIKEPLICVPLTGASPERILAEAEKCREAKVAMVEWRLDCYDDCFCFPKMLAFLKKLREILHEQQLLATFRTRKEGGNKACETAQYIELYEHLIKSDLIDLIDVELSMGEKAVDQLMTLAHENNRKVILSYHNFQQTPPPATLLRYFDQMVSLNADLLKIAVMPQTEEDVIQLMLAAREAHQRYHKPLIAIAMGELGKITRVCAEFLGSAVTFASIDHSSAPGQIPISQMRRYLSFFHSIAAQLKEE